jgi:CHAT domain-containing protein
MLAIGNPSLQERGPSVGRPAIDAVRHAGDVLVPLPYAEEEAGAIARLFGAEGGDLLTGQAATLERWRALEPGRYEYLHFAVHALVHDRQPGRSGLLLSGGDLDVAAIQRLSLSAALVTLSACETGLGRNVRGEGIIGLPYAFLSAGARGVVVSLWPVADRSTADFMREFYGKLHGGAAPAAALLEVRREWIARGAAAAHPSRWAAFVLVGGEPQP